MGGARRGRRLGGIVAAVFAGLLVLAMADGAQAQTAAGGAEIKQMTGRVEVLRKGQNEWAPATNGAKLVDGDQIRAHAGASAELGLPDGSTLFLAENSRLACPHSARNDEQRFRKHSIAVQSCPWGQTCVRCV